MKFDGFNFSPQHPGEVAMCVSNAIRTRQPGKATQWILIKRHAEIHCVPAYLLRPHQPHWGPFSALTADRGFTAKQWSVIEKLFTKLLDLET